MKLTADYHTHTKFSHGKGTILQNAQRAKELGLKQIAITDHGFSHMAFNMKRKKLEKMREEAKMATKLTGVNVLIGCESNLTSFEGDIDAKKEDNLDILVCGFHKLVKTKKGQFFSLCVSNIFRELFMGKKRYHKAPINKKWVVRNTKALVNAIENNNIDIVSHPNRHFRVDVLEIAKACEKTGTAYELNGKNIGASKEEIKLIVEKTNCNFVLDSDAHHPKRVGDVEKALEVIKDIVPEERILNVNGKILKRKSQGE